MPAFLNYENLNYEQLSGLNASQTVVFIPCGPLEQQGAQPLGEDAFSARRFSEKAAERLGAASSLKGWSFVLYPTVFLGTDVPPHPGSLGVKPRTLRAVLLAIVGGLAKNGFKNIVLVGAHGGPRNIVVLEEVAARARWRWRARAVSALARVLPRGFAGEFSARMDGFLDETVPWLEKYCNGERVEKKFRSASYFVPLFRTDFFLVAALFAYALLFLILVRWSAHMISGF